MTLDPRRRFTSTQRTALYLHADGCCEHCGGNLDSGFDADHLIPHSRSGRTDVVNGAASCSHCNRSRKDKIMLTASTRQPAPLGHIEAGLSLRDWQQRAIPKMLDHKARSFLLHVAPGGGKTIPSLFVARHLIERGEIARVVIVTPTANLARQWAVTAHRIGLNVTPNWEGQREPRDMHGIVITYQRVRHGALALAAGCRASTLVIADEPHHLGADRSWAAAFEQAFAQATRWLLLSGTPFRSDGRPIPGVRYEQNEASSDFTYSYAQAIADGVCRRVSFNFYDGQLRWISDGRRVEADFTLALARREASRRLRTALTPELSEGLRQMIGDAFTQLQEVREDHPDAGMLVVCESIEHAQATAQIAEQVIGQPPVLITSDDPDATARIARFRTSNDPCVVAVNMVSEGVDIPRLRVGVYATPKKTPMLFRQIVGRFVRTGSGPDSACSHLFLPRDPELHNLAIEIEQEIAHRLPDPEDLLITDDAEDESATAPPDEPQMTFHPLAFEPQSRDALLSGTVVPPDEAAWIDRLAHKRGVSPDEILRRLDGTGAAAIERLPEGSAQPAYEQVEKLRRSRRRLVGRLHRITGTSHADLNVHVNKLAAAGRPVRDATVEELRAGNDLLERMIERSQARLAPGTATVA
jgi:superfamily II DNA or RNA helicase